MGPKTNDVDRIDADETLEIEGEEESVSPAIQATRVQIEQTRGEMSETIDAIREKLQPQALADQARDTVAEVSNTVAEKAKESVHEVIESVKSTVGETLQSAKETLPTLTANAAQGVKETVSSAASGAKQAVGSAAGAAKDAGATLMEAIQKNPVPAALIALGVGWLWATNRGSSRQYPEWDAQRYRTPYDEGTWGAQAMASDTSDASMGALGESPNLSSTSLGERAGRAAEKVKESAGEVAHRVGEKLGAIGDRTGDYARGVASSYQSMAEERPLVLGTIALGLGVALGLLLPGSEQENRLMGDTRDQLVGKVGEKVSDTAQDLAERAHDAAERAIDTVADRAQTVADNAIEAAAEKVGA